MIEFDVDMGYLLEYDELDKVVLNDENGEHEPMEFVPKDAATAGVGTCEVEYVNDWMVWHCKSCDTIWMGLRDQKPSYCMRCGRRIEVDE